MLSLEDRIVEILGRSEYLMSADGLTPELGHAIAKGIIATMEIDDKRLALAWDSGVKQGMERLALKCCVRTTLLKEAIEEALKYNPYRF